MFFIQLRTENESQIEQASTSIADSLGCADSKSKVFDAFYNLLDQSQKIPQLSEIKTSLKIKLANLKFEKNMATDDIKKMDIISEKFSTVIDLMLSESIKNPKKDFVEQMQSLIEYEMELRSSEDVSK